MSLLNRAVAAVIPGASSVEQLRENCQAIQSDTLSSEEIQLLTKLTKASVYDLHRD